MTSLTNPLARSDKRAWIMLIVLTMLTVIGMTVVLPVLPFVVLQYVSHEGDLAIWVGVLEAKQVPRSPHAPDRGALTSVCQPQVDKQWTDGPHSWESWGL